MRSRNHLTERYQDVLQNLEFGVMQVAHENPDLLNYHVEQAYEALIRYYKAEARGHEPRTPDLDSPIADVFESVRDMAEFRLGRNPLQITRESTSDDAVVQPPPIQIDVMVTCLKRLRKSVQFWSQRGGRRGYLEYIKNFFPD
jgi:hypothetical protein